LNLITFNFDDNRVCPARLAYDSRIIHRFWQEVFWVVEIN